MHPAVRRLRLVAATAAIAVALPIVHASAQAALIEEVTESLDQARDAGGIGDGCRDGQTIETVTQPVRAGQHAFLHTVEDCGERAEMAGSTTEYGQEYWYGWALRRPPEATGRGIVNQWAVYPTDKNFRQNGCSAVGSYAQVGGDSLEFVFRYPGQGDDIPCQRFELATLEQLTDQWVDIVMHVRWTEERDGFLEIWAKVGDGEYVKKADYVGPTHWADEGPGPYMKLGAYTGSPRNDGTTHIIYTDEYRLAGAGAAFADVAPGGAQPPGVPSVPAPTPTAIPAPTGAPAPSPSVTPTAMPTPGVTPTTTPGAALPPAVPAQPSDPSQSWLARLLERLGDVLANLFD